MRDRCRISTAPTRLRRIQRLRLDLKTFVGTQQLREDRSLIPGFIEESLRMDSPVKGDSRLARKATTVGGVDIPAGTVVMVLAGAVDRDPRGFENPHEFSVYRRNVREHMAFARGVHCCLGGPLARVGRCFDRAHPGPDVSHRN
jgi:cytochrome P450